MGNGRWVPGRAVGMLLLAGALLAAPLSAATINVLWYTGGVESFSPGDYGVALNALAADAPGAPGGNTWNITQWAGGTMPAGSYNVLVVASPVPGWITNPDYSALATAASGIALGDRIMVTGQDADYHNLTYPGPTPFDGPHGFLLDGINWAGGGTGLGLVALGADPNNYGFSLTGYSPGTGFGTDNVQIPAAFASFPINTGLTSAGLSNWFTSSHDLFQITDPIQWTGINVDGNSGDFVTIVSAQTAAGDITTPEPATFALFGLGLSAAVFLRRRSA